VPILNDELERRDVSLGAVENSSDADKISAYIERLAPAIDAAVYIGGELVRSNKYHHTISQSMMN
jgi:hypothetical protein